MWRDDEEEGGEWEREGREGWWTSGRSIPTWAAWGASARTIRRSIPTWARRLRPRSVTPPPPPATTTTSLRHHQHHHRQQQADEKQHSTRERLLTTQLQELKVRLEEAEAIKVEQHTSILGLNDRIVALEAEGRNQSRIRDDADAKLGRAAQRVGLAFGKIMTVLGGGDNDADE